MTKRGIFTDRKNSKLKLIFSILLLSVLVFNWVGYRLVLGVMENNADEALEQKIYNSEYDEASLIEIKVPLDAPYLSDYFSEFDRYVGELELNGVHYKYVKRKIINGELVLFCLPNKAKTDLQNSRQAFFNLVNDLQHSQTKEKHSSTPTIKGVAIEYQKETNCWYIADIPPIPVNHFTYFPSLVSLGYDNVPERPPKA